LASAVERAAARRLRAAEADLERALARGAELGERLRQVGAEGEAWRGVATGHEAAAADLRATLDQLLRAPPRAGAVAAEEGQGVAEAEDAGSCCFGPAPREGRRACRSCGAADACVLLLPCRHLCLCGVCDASAEACPVCAATKNASLHVLLS
jgi:E3 ubiquitin-protein ligase BOI-like protein